MAIGEENVAVRHPAAVLAAVAVPSVVPDALRRVTVRPVLVEAAQNLIETTRPARLELNLTPTVVAWVLVTAWVAGVAVGANSEKSAVVVVNVHVFADVMTVPVALAARTDAVYVVLLVSAEVGVKVAVRVDAL